jgi:hypothetical protein
MENRPRTRRWPLAAAAATAAVLLATLVLVAPFLVNTPAVREAIRERLEGQLGGRLSFERIELSLVPHPCAVLRRPELRWPRQAALRSEALSACPQLLPLLKGRFEPGAVRLETPVLEWTMPASAPDPAPLRRAPLREILTAAAATIKGIPETLVVIENGKVVLTEATGAEWEIRNLRGSLERHGRGLDATIACESDSWDRLTLKGGLDTETVTGSARVDLAGFRPAGILRRLFPAADIEILDGLAQLDLAADFDGTGRIKAGFHSEVSAVRLRHRKRDMAFGEGRISADLEMNAGRLTLTAHGIELNAPRLSAALALTFDPETHPRIAAEISGSEVDADAVRETALFLMPESEDVRDIFNVVRGGRVARITVKMSGDRPAELSKAGNLFIRGHMEGGKIFIPGAGLDLDEVRGDAVISGGILEGTHLEARYRGSRGTEGRLRIGLTAEEPVLEHSIFVDADLAELPAVLGRVIENAAFRAELNRVQQFQGTARGTLRLSGTRRTPQVRVEAEDVRIEARYEPLGLPLAFRGGRVSYDRAAAALEVAGLDVRIGRSAFTRLDARLALEAPFALRAAAPAADLDLAEAFALAKGLFPEATRGAGIRSVDGRARLEGLRLEGPAAAWRAWNVTAAGGISGLTVRSDHLPAPLELASGSFRWAGRKLSAAGWDATLGPSTLSGISGQADWGTADRLDLSAESARIVWDELFPWLAGLGAAAPLRDHVADIRGILTASGLSLKGPLGKPGQWRLGGRCEIEDLLVRTTFLEEPVRIEGGRVSAEAPPAETPGPVLLQLDSIRVNSGGNRLAGGGSLALSPADIALDLSVTAERIDWNEIRKLSDRLSERTQGERRLVRGRVVVRAQSFAYERFRFEPFHADVRVDAAGTQVALERAEVCGIPLVGRLGFTDRGLDAYLAPIADGKELDGLITCLTDKNALATGRYNIDGALQVKGRSQDLLKSLTGEIQFVAEKGRILRSSLLARILALVNVTEIYKGKLPDLSGEGVAYDRMQVAAELKDGKLLIHSWTIDGPSLWMGSRGEVNLASNRLDLTVLVSPFKTVDRIINQIPGVRWILGGRLVAIPIKASGDVFDPQVTPLHPAAVGTGLLEMLERTLMLPATIIQPLLPGTDGQSAMEKSTIRKE